MSAKVKIYRHWRGILTARDCRAFGGGCTPSKKWGAVKKRPGERLYGYGNTEAAAVRDLEHTHGIVARRITATRTATKKGRK